MPRNRRKNTTLIAALSEIACTLDLSLAAVKNRLTSARHQLQAQVQARFPELVRERFCKEERNG